MRRATLMAFVKIIVKHRLDVQRAVPCRHRQYPDIFLYYDYKLVFINNLDIAAFQLHVVTLALAYRHFHARLQWKIELSDELSVHLNPPTTQRCLYLRTAFMLDIFKQELQ